MIVPRMNRLEEKKSYLAQRTQNLPHLNPGKNRYTRRRRRKGREGKTENKAGYTKAAL